MLTGVRQEEALVEQVGLLPRDWPGSCGRGTLLLLECSWLGLLAEQQVSVQSPVRQAFGGQERAPVVGHWERVPAVGHWELAPEMKHSKVHHPVKLYQFPQADVAVGTIQVR